MLECNTAFVAIAVTQWDAMVQFYNQLTGQYPDPYRSDVYAEFCLGNIQIGLFYPKVSHQAEFTHSRTAKFSLCLEVDNLDQSRQAIDDAYTALSATVPDTQTRLGEVAIASHGRECYAYDPDGNRLILHEAISR